jgi:hypothetical protein
VKISILVLVIASFLAAFILEFSQPPLLAQNINCDPAYPDENVCIPPPPPDLDCGEIEYRNFTVLPPDPHHFDGDKDGIGCEKHPSVNGSGYFQADESSTTWTAINPITAEFH